MKSASDASQLWRASDRIDLNAGQCLYSRTRQLSLSFSSDEKYSLNIQLKRNSRQPHINFRSTSQSTKCAGFPASIQKNTFATFFFFCVFLGIGSDHTHTPGSYVFCLSFQLLILWNAADKIIAFDWLETLVWESLLLFVRCSATSHRYPVDDRTSQRRLEVFITQSTLFFSASRSV